MIQGEVRISIQEGVRTLLEVERIVPQGVEDPQGGEVDEGGTFARRLRSSFCLANLLFFASFFRDSSQRKVWKDLPSLNFEF